MKITGIEIICAFIAFVSVYFVRGQGLSAVAETCSQMPDPGECRASVPRYYFDSESGRCKTFIYGGCGGNHNNFENVGQCNSFRNFCLKRGS